MPSNFPPPKKELESTVARFNCWMWRRYMSTRGNNYAIVALEIQAVFDTLMRDMGLKVQRKRKGIFGIFREYFNPYKAANYHGIVEELLERARKEKEKEKESGVQRSHRRTPTMSSIASF